LPRRCYFVSPAVQPCHVSVEPCRSVGHTGHHARTRKRQPRSGAQMYASDKEGPVPGTDLYLCTNGAPLLVHERRRTNMAC
jgi:hypothetical protein